MRISKFETLFHHEVKPSRIQIAIFLAALFHISGFIGMQTTARPWFVGLTPLNLFLMVGLIFFTENQLNRPFFYFFALAFGLGFATEWIGVHTGMLFGDYAYSHLFGPKLLDIPILIGFQWFATTYCSSHVVLFFFKKTGNNFPEKLVHVLLFAVFAAGLTTFFDYTLEPVAIQLGYWHWFPNNAVPLLNYISWFFISLLLHLMFFSSSKNTKTNVFAIALFFIQVLFFLGMQ